METTKHLLRYLKGTSNLGLLNCNKPLALHAYFNANCAINEDNIYFTIAYVISLVANLVSWSSKKQKFVSMSSTEVEFHAVTTTTAKACWLHSLLCRLHVTSSTISIIYYDNFKATYLSANLVFHSKIKHVRVDFHFIREKVVFDAI